MAGVGYEPTIFDRERERRVCPRRCKVGPSRERGAEGSNLSVFGKGKCVFHINSEIAHRVLDLAMAKKDLEAARTVRVGPFSAA